MSKPFCSPVTYEKYVGRVHEAAFTCPSYIAQAAHRQKQQAFAYCLIPCLLSQFLRTIVRMLSNQARAKNPTAISHARLFGEACYARERIKTQATVSLYRLLGICACGASGKMQFACYARVRITVSDAIFSQVTYAQVRSIAQTASRRQQSCREARYQTSHHNVISSPSAISFQHSRSSSFSIIN